MQTDKTNTPTDVRIYFELERAEDDNETRYETALEEMWSHVSDLSESSRIWNEGHAADSGLVCYFIVPWGKIRQLHERILSLRGGGDDIIYLPCGFTASQFKIVEQPGISCPVLFDDWDEWLPFPEDTTMEFRQYSCGCVTLKAGYHEWFLYACDTDDDGVHLERIDNRPTPNRFTDKAFTTVGVTPKIMRIMERLATLVQEGHRMEQLRTAFKIAKLT